MTNNTITNTEYFDIQRKIVANMTSQSWHDVPHVSYMYEADVSDFLTVFRLLNDERAKKDRISLNTLSLKIISEAIKEAPEMNAHIEFNRKFVKGRIDTIEEINISMPMILPNGKMMTVNLHDFGNKSLDEMTRYINDIRRRSVNTDLNEAMFEVSFNDTIKALKKGEFRKAADRLLGSKLGKHRVKTLHGNAKKEYYAIPESERLTAKDLEQGTITVSNIGSVCRSANGAPSLIEIVPPQVCAFAIGAVSEKPVVRTGADGRKKTEVGTVLPITVCFDHRALDFGDIVPFINKLDEIFASPEILLKWFGKDETEISVISA